MQEACCFESEHRYIPHEHGGYSCISCHEHMSVDEFEKRSKATNWVDGMAPIRFCEICGAWHVPYGFDINSRLSFMYLNRHVEVCDMKNGKYVFETDRDESGYVTAQDWKEAVSKIKCSIGKRRIPVNIPETVGS